MDPRVRIDQHFGHCADLDPVVDQHRDSVGDGDEAVEIVRHHEHGETQAVLEVAHEAVEFVGGDGIKSGGRLVEEEQRRVERKRAREPRALAHAARKLGRILEAAVARQSDQCELEGAQLVEQRLRQSHPLLEGNRDILGHGERAEQRAVLEHHAPAPDDPLERVGARPGDILAEHLDRARGRRQDADNGLEQHRLAGARGADHRENLAPMELEIDVAVQQPARHARCQPREAEHGLRGRARRR